MTVTTEFAGMPFPRYPISNITPFTYRDGLTFLEMIEAFRTYINDIIVTGINDNMLIMLQNYEAALAEIIAQGNENIAAVTELFDDFTTDITNQQNDYAAHIQAIVDTINNKSGMIEVQHVILNSDFAVDMDVTWPTNLPVVFRFTQDVDGGHKITPGVRVESTPQIDQRPGIVTEVTYLPNGDGTFTGTRAVLTDEVHVSVRDHGATGDGITNDTAAFVAAIAKARATGAFVYVPAGVYVITEGLDISGADIRGDARGYRGANGAVLKGATGVGWLLEQKQSAIRDLTMRISGITLRDIQHGIRLTYSVYSHISDVTILCEGTGIKLGDSAMLGPLFNDFDRVQIVSTSITVPAVILQGKEWCNSNSFNNCFFRSNFVSFQIENVGGFGAVNTLFNGTELMGDGVGFKNFGPIVSTTFDSCYFETHGPCIWLGGSSTDTAVNTCVFGSLVNTNYTGKVGYIHHASGPTRLLINGGWVTTGSGPEYNNLRLLTSDLPASCTFQYARTPSLGGVVATGFQYHDWDVLKEVERIMYGNMAVSTHAAPQMVIRYSDNSKPFTIKRNGTAGGDDFGVDFINDGIKALTINANGGVVLEGGLVMPSQKTATTLGPMVRAFPLMSPGGVIWGWVPVYSTAT